MLVKTLVENTAISDEYACEHGLSLYIEAKGKKILFDVGASGKFFDNAQKMGVDIKDVDYLIISHGHNDHGGGLKKFFAENDKAEVFIHRLAFEKHFTTTREGMRNYIGLDESLKHEKQITMTSGSHLIEHGIRIFSEVEERVPVSASNFGLLYEHENTIDQDIFEHEQNLVIEDEGKSYLFVGCAHKGLINIIQQCDDYLCGMPDYVIGGFHLSSRSAYDATNEELDKLSAFLLETGAEYYTGHCTGIRQFKYLQEKMGDKIHYIAAGSVINI